MVGAVIVNTASEIIGEGFHQAYGEPHAEVNAVREALSRGHNLKGTTIYVSLEPCAHQGKTPPCADLILKHGFAKLVFASHDPNPLVSGKGLGKLARTEIISPELLDPSIVQAAEYLNRAFFKTIKRESWVTAKIAITEDGRMITRADEPRWITNTNARRDVHLMRASHQAVITGMGTVRADNPQLNVRYSADELGIAQVMQPKRIVLQRDSGGILPATPSARCQDDKTSNNMRLMDGSDLKSLISELRQEGLTKLMLEAGPTLTQAFIDQRLIDELIIYQPLKREPEAAAKELQSQYPRNKSLRYEIIPASEDEADNLKVSLLF
jgi:diaminohydroxyphosphoribosylaminopyrimidine deaminase/5-amino-6-(5-phosphoribosylamino)uracil reductase